MSKKILTLLLLVTVAFSACDKQPSDPVTTAQINTTATTKIDAEDSQITIEFVIDTSILENYDIGSGIILETSYKTVENSTVFEVLEKLCSDNKIALEYSGKVDDGTVYVTKIADITENMIKTKAGWSAWVYKVNGESAVVGCSEYKLKDGDVVEFYFTDGSEM